MTEDLFGERRTGADISEDGIYRYSLWRYWGRGDPLIFVMLNPSTADESANDKTVRRCIGFAEREGCGGIEVINLYALRCTKPEHLLHHPDPEGPRNAEVWKAVLSRYDGAPVVAAWGAGADSELLPDPMALAEVLARGAADGWRCLGKTASGSPRHPLFCSSRAPLVPF